MHGLARRAVLASVQASGSVYVYSRQVCERGTHRCCGREGRAVVAPSSWVGAPYLQAQTGEKIRGFGYQI